MVMATDALIKKAITTTTNLNAMIPQIWAARVEKNLRKHRVFEQSAVVNTDLLVPGAGNTTYIPILPDLAAAVALTEGTDMTPIALSNASSVALTPTEYGVTVDATRKALDRIKYDGVAEIMDRLSYAMSLAIEGTFAGLWNVVVPGTSNKFGSVYANGKASGTITTSDTFNDALILSGVSQMEQQNNVPFDDGFYRLYLHPVQYAALLQDTNTRNDLRWGASQRLITGANDMITGEKGILHGVRIIVTNYVNTATENSNTVYKAMLVAPRAYAVAYKRRPQVVVDPTLYDLGRRRRFGVVADFDIEPLHNERAFTLTSC